MDHARHRAERRSSRLRMIASAAAGVLVGLCLATATWVVFAGPPWRDEPPIASKPADRSTGQASVAQPKTVDDRGVVASARPRAEPTTSGAADPILLTGDSLAVGIAPYVDAGVGERPLTVDAAEGRGTGTQVGLLSGYASSSAPIWIVSLGTNDNPDDFAKLAPDVMQLAGADRCVVWFDVWRIDTHDEINASLADLASRHDNLHLVPWHLTSERHPEWFTGVDVHPSSTGYAVRGQMAVDSVARWCDGA